jgi:hypothetical protein
MPPDGLKESARGRLDERGIQRWVLGAKARVMSCGDFLALGSARSLSRGQRAKLDAEQAAMINDELAKINRNGKLPGGIVLAGGGAKLKGISQFLSAELKLPASVATVPSFVGVSEEVKDLNCAALLGLTLMDGEQDTEGEPGEAAAGLTSGRGKGRLSPE